MTQLVGFSTGLVRRALREHMCPFAATAIAVMTIAVPRPLCSFAQGNRSAQLRDIGHDLTELQRTRGPNEREEPGVLQYGGYCTLGPQLTKTGYQNAADPAKEATVEVVVHPEAYRYAVHDFFGTLWVVFHDENKKRAAGKGGGKAGIFAFEEFRRSGGAKPEVVCVVAFPKGTGGRELLEGIVGWYGIEAEKVTTVMIRFENLGGIPSGVVDTYLAKYPSAVEKDDKRFANWEANDIRKWIDLIRAGRDEELVLSGAGLYLRRLDSGAFGLTEALNKRGDPVALNEAVGRSIERMKAWLEDHEKAKGRDGRP